MTADLLEGDVVLRVDMKALVKQMGPMMDEMAGNIGDQVGGADPQLAGAAGMVSEMVSGVPRLRPQHGNRRPGAGIG